MGWSTEGLSCEESDMKTVLIKVGNLIARGARNSGYTTIVLNDCWMADERTPEGHLTHDTERFPRGLKAVSDALKNNGFELGIALSAGSKTCDNNKPGSLGFEQQDAEDMHAWGVKYLMYEDCGDESIDKNLRFGAMKDAIDR